MIGFRGASRYYTVTRRHLLSSAAPSRECVTSSGSPTSR
jgi:hypothetical protein